MLEKLKKYCEKELSEMKKIKNFSEKYACLTRAYGATMFVLNYVSDYDKEVESWWENEMLPSFRKELM